MKKSMFTPTLIALGAAGLLYTAAAQPPADVTAPPAADQTPPPDAPAAPTAPLDNGGTAVAPDNGATPPNAGSPDADQTAAMAGANDATAPDNGTRSSTSILPTEQLGSEQPKFQSHFMPPDADGTNSPDLRLNFRNAPLEMVLNYLSDAAGFIIVLDTPVRGSVSIISRQPVTKDEAVDLLNSVLNKNGYAAIRDGRTLTIVDKNDAKTRDIPVKVESDPAKIPKNAEIVTQIIPIRFVEARQLVSDLSSFVSPEATVVANDAGNSIVITDTQQNIRHLAEIIKAIDDSAEAETEIKVFRLHYASPVDVATELGNIFPSSNGSGSQSPIRFGAAGGGNPFAAMFGRGGFGGGGFGGGGGGAGGAAGNSNSDRIKKETQVTAVADPRIQAVIVTAPKDLMVEISGMMTELDVPSDRDQDVYTFKMSNGDPQEVATVLQGMFQGNSSRNNTSSQQNSALQYRTQNNNTTTGTSSSSSGFGTTGGGGGGGGGGRAF